MMHINQGEIRFRKGSITKLTSDQVLNNTFIFALHQLTHDETNFSTIQNYDPKIGQH